MKFTVTIDTKNKRRAAIIRDEVAQFCEDLRDAEAKFNGVTVSDIEDAPAQKSATELLRSIVADVEAMRDREQGEHAFGAFSEPEDTGFVGYIEWPNLSILIEQAKELIK